MLKREIQLFVKTLIYLLLGVGSVWVFKLLPSLDGNTSAFILFIPIIAYLVFSDKLQEFAGPGGFAFKLSTVAKQTIQPVKLEHFELSSEVVDIDSFLQARDETKPLVLTLTVGENVSYDVQELKNKIKRLNRSRNFNFIVIIDSKDNCIAYIAGWRMLKILETGGYEVLQLINNCKQPEELREKLNSSPGFIINSIDINTTRIDVLSQMITQRIDAAVVTDNNKVAGVVEREILLIPILFVVA